MDRSSTASTKAAPKWLLPLLKANFRTFRTSKSDINNYGFFCMNCMGCAFREIDKLDHPGHEILRAVKASHHFAVCVSDVIERLNCEDIAKFSVNDKKIFFLNSRAKPETLKKSKDSGSSKGTCVACRWRLPEGYANCLYCSLGCKFKRNDGTNEEELPMHIADQQENVNEAKAMSVNISYRKRSRKGIPRRGFPPSPVRV